MTPVAGLDLSVSRTGLALPDGTVHSITPPKDLRGGERLAWIKRAFLRTVTVHPPLPRLFIVEDYPIYNGKAGGTVAATINRLHGVIQEVIWTTLAADELRIPPAQLKRWATGDGRADKNRMVATAVAEGAPVRNDDEADAWWLRHLGLTGLGHQAITGPRQLQDARRDVLAGIDWSVIR